MKKFLLSWIVAVSLAFLSPEMSLAQIELAIDPDLPTADAWDFTRYGVDRPSLYTGAVSVSIPIYVYKDKDFEIPVSLDYSSNGLKPSMQPGVLGAEWHLNVGGCITREVRGIPDDIGGNYSIIINNPSTGWREVLVQCYGIEDLASPSSVNTTEYACAFMGAQSSMTGGRLFLYTVSDGRRCDVETDVYRFSFMGHTGEFQKLYEDGEYHVYNCSDNSESYRIQSNMKKQTGENSILYAYSQFVITTGDGYRYYFGDDDIVYDGQSVVVGDGSGSLDKMHLVNTDRNISQAEIDRIDDKTQRLNGTIVAWKLTKIIAPNGRTIDFIYNETNVQRRVINSSPSSWVFASGLDSNNFESETEKSAVARMQTSQLVGIMVDGTTVAEFTYTDNRPLGKYVNENMGISSLQRNDVAPLLESIHIVNSDETITMDYATISSASNSVPFLQSVSSSLGRYSFDYNMVDNMSLPPFGTYAIDHYGFYKGGNNHTVKYATSYIQDADFEEGDYTETLYSGRNPDANYSQIGTLHKVTYPTGGYTIFSYEPRDYGRTVKRDYGSMFVPYLTDISSEPQIGGGVRVSRIVNYDSDGSVLDSRSYEYVLADGTTSSGIELQFPRYQVQYTGDWNGYTPQMVYSAYRPLISSNDIDIEYSRVEEILPDSSKNVYYYETYETLPNMFASTLVERVGCMRIYGNVIYPMILDNIPNETALFNLLTPATSLQAFRGKLLKQEIYANDSIVRSDSMIYNTFVSENVSRPVYVSEGVREVPELFANRLQTSKISILDGVEQTIRYTYNEYGQVRRMSVSRSDGGLDCVIYTYPDRDNPATAIEQKMVEFNYMQYPLSITRTVLYPTATVDPTEYIVGRDSIIYAVLSENVLPVEIRRLDVQTNQWYIDEKYTYDINGNVCQSENRNGTYTTYFWNKFGVTMRVENASNSQIEALDEAYGNLFERPVQPIIPASVIREGLPEASVTTFEYDDNGNLVSQTDPSGRKIEYDYDRSGRITRISDDQANPITKYIYSTATQNTES